jgi:hypothetical protein
LRIACVPEKGQFCVKKGHGAAYPNFKPMMTTFEHCCDFGHLRFFTVLT